MFFILISANIPPGSMARAGGMRVILRTNEACYIYQLLNEAILSCETEPTVLDDQTAKAVGNGSAGKVVAPLLTFDEGKVQE